MGFSSGGGRHRGGEGPQIWDASQAAAVQRVEDEQRGEVLRSLAATLAEAQEPGKSFRLRLCECNSRPGALTLLQVSAAHQQGTVLHSLAACLAEAQEPGKPAWLATDLLHLAARPAAWPASGTA